MTVPARLPLLALILFATAPVSAAEKPSARWMAHCAANLKAEARQAAVVRAYCACMAGIGEEAEMLTWSQSDLEHSYPPAHAQCHDKARGRRVRPM
jgi:hypothetical protein